jgi:hypothetical protein
MLQSPAYQPLFDELLTYVSREEFRTELVAGRVEFVQNTGEAFEEDRSFEPRLQAFLDWFIFDRPLRTAGEPPARAYAREDGLASDPLVFRQLSRTIHGIFHVDRIDGRLVKVTNEVTGSRHEVTRDMQVWELKKGNLFEGRLVPFNGELHFSSAFLFYPPELRKRIAKEARKTSRRESPFSVQELIFTLARMAARAEHYRNVELDDIFDFERPPPKVPSVRLQFDPESVARRLTSDPPPRSKRLQSRHVVTGK